MVIELSAETYDWDRACHEATALIDTIQALAETIDDAPEIPLSDAPDPETALDPESSGGWSDWQGTWQQIVEQHRDHLSGLPEKLDSAYWGEDDSSTPGAHLTITSGSSSHHFKLVTNYQPDGSIEVTALRMNLWGEGGMQYVFTKTPLSDLGYADWDRLRDEMRYYYKFKREAELLSRETLLSQREAEVLVLQREGWDDSYIARVAEISESTISTYRQRRDEKKETAQEAKQEAERTLEVFNDAGALPTSRCAELPADVGQAALEWGQNSGEVAAQFVWLPDEYQTPEGTSGLSTATFWVGESGAVLSLSGREGDTVYVLDADVVENEAAAFDDAGGQDGRWVRVGDAQ